METVFSIILPITRPPFYLPFAIESVLWQDYQNFNLLIVCDGAPPATVELAHEYAEKDQRIHVFSREKGKRHGEAHRHEALMQVPGTYVAHICDDDMWLSNHLSEMKRLLDEYDFGNTLHVLFAQKDLIGVRCNDLFHEETRQAMLTRKLSFFGLTTAGYRMSAYMKLEEGWAPAPADVWTDLHMWRKFLRHPEITCGTRYAITSVIFPRFRRLKTLVYNDVAEARTWFERLRDPAVQDRYRQAAWRSVIERLRDTDTDFHGFNRE